MATDPQSSGGPTRPPRGQPGPRDPRQRRAGLWVLAGIVGSIVAVVLLAIWAAHNG
ncbi:MAG TPA: hypothetical protein VHC49_04105 [Mycobacteriales bacterium]|nr:hypothetical protein [Mycobacteriales bacterium]